MIKVLEESLKVAFKALGYDGDFGAVTKSNRPDLCDYQCNDIFKVAKIYKESPVTIGEKIINFIKNKENYNYIYKSVEFVLPGFLNIKVSNKLIASELKRRLDSNNLGINKPEVEKTIFLDYGGPNVAKPLHVGHLRPAIIGESLKRIAEALGHKTISDIHLGDFGLQIGQVILGLKEKYPHIKDYDTLFFTIDDLEEIYPKMSKKCSEDEKVLEEAKKITKELQEGNREYQKLWKLIYDVSVSDIKRLYKILDVSFDLWQGESDCYKYIPEVMKYLEEKNLIEVDEGAKIIRIEEERDTKEMPPFILEKSDGAYLYSTTDFAAIYNRIKTYKPDNILYVVDSRQSLHFEQVFRVAKKVEIAKDTILEHIKFGTMNGPDGRPFKTRSGAMLKLEELINLVKEEFIKMRKENTNISEEDLNIIANAIIKFADLGMHREKNYIFDIEKFSQVNGKTGPYILYTYLRINKILEKNKKENYSILENPINEYDEELRKKLLDFEIVINNAFNERLPHYIAEYLYNLCDTVNSLYQNTHIQSMENIEEKKSLIATLTLTNKIIKSLLNLLVIDIPSKM